MYLPVSLTCVIHKDYHERSDSGYPRTELITHQGGSVRSLKPVNENTFLKNYNTDLLIWKCYMSGVDILNCKQL